MNEIKLTIPAKAFQTTVWVARGRHRKATEVRAGIVKVTNTSAAVAKQEAATITAAFLDALEEQRHLIVSRGDFTYVGYCLPGTIEQPVQFGYDMTHEGRRVGACLGNATSWNELKAAMRRHVAQNTHDPHSDESLAATAKWAVKHGAEPNGDEIVDLYRSAAWQRAYVHADGMGEKDPHRWACEHQNGWYVAVGLNELGRLVA